MMTKIAVLVALKIWLNHRRHYRTKVVKWSRMFPDSGVK